MFLLLRSWRLSGSSSFTHATSLAVEIVSGSLPSPVIWTIIGSPKEKDSCSWPRIAQSTQGSWWLGYRLPRDRCICKISDPTRKKNSNEYHFKGFQQGNQSSLQCGMHFLLNYCKLHIQAQVQDFYQYFEKYITFKTTNKQKLQTASDNYIASYNWCVYAPLHEDKCYVKVKLHAL